MKHLKTIILLFIICFYTNQSFGQRKNLDKIISVSFDNISVQEAIHQLTQKTGCNFSFSANLLPPNEQVRLLVKNKTLSFVLSTMLENHKLDFMEVNNQIIIYAMNKPFGSNNNPDKPVNSFSGAPGTNKQVQPDSIFKTKVFDTIPIYDTIRTIVRETIKSFDTVRIQHIDTIKIYDTVRVVVKTEAKATKKKAPDLYFSIEPGFSFERANYTIANKDAANPYFELVKGSINAGNGLQIKAWLNIHFKNLVVQTGCTYSYFTENWNNTQKGHGGHYVNDTISKYYTGIHGTDTAWVYITRERWVETLALLKTQTNFFTHTLNIPVIIGYKIPLKKLALEVKGGIISNILLKTTGEGIFSKDSIFFENAANKYSLFTHLNISAYLAVAFILPLEENTQFIIGPYYNKNLLPFYNNNYWYTQKFSFYGISVGLRKKF